MCVVFNKKCVFEREGKCVRGAEEGRGQCVCAYVCSEMGGVCVCLCVLQIEGRIECLCECVKSCVYV